MFGSSHEQASGVLFFGSRSDLQRRARAGHGTKVLTSLVTVQPSGLGLMAIPALMVGALLLLGTTLTEGDTSMKVGEAFTLVGDALTPLGAMLIRVGSTVISSGWICTPTASTWISLGLTCTRHQMHQTLFLSMHAPVIDLFFGTPVHLAGDFSK